MTPRQRPTTLNLLDIQFEKDRKVRLLHGINRLISRVYHNIEVIGEPRVPRDGPAIVISNHISSLDPLLIQSVIDRPIVWMMAKEYYDIAALNWVFRAIHVIPVSRDGRDSAALRAALRTLQRGRVLGIFPEGKIETTRELLPFQTGVAMIAKRSRTRIIPVYQTGSTHGHASMIQAVLMPQDVRIAFGPLIDLAKAGLPEGDLAAATRLLEASVKSLQRSADFRTS